MNKKLPFRPDHFFENLPSTSPKDFESKALSLFGFQYSYNAVYREYAQRTGKTPEHINTIHKIPFLPISFFKTHPVFCGDTYPEKFFLSSGTTSSHLSRSYVTNLPQYLQNCRQCFTHHWGPLNNYIFLVLIPLLKNKEHSSLICMAEFFINQSHHPLSGFYVEREEILTDLLQSYNDEFPSNKKIVLIGLSILLVDFFQKHPIHAPDLIIIETGGMKGRKREMTRYELHEFLKKQTGVPRVYSEYGMTELMSQAYISPKCFIRKPLNLELATWGLKYRADNTSFQSFLPPPWMKILIREVNDPFQYLPNQRRGAINVIDLANIHTCAFLELEDLGLLNEDGSFQVLGRMDFSELRGCNLMLFS